MKPRMQREHEQIATRDSETRMHDMYPDYNMGYVSNLDLPPGVAREGYSYYWACKGIRGQDDFTVEKLGARGWVMVPVDRAPQYSFDPLKRNPLSNQYICTGDLILMELPSELNERQTRYFNQQNRHKLNCLYGVEVEPEPLGPNNRNINSF